MPTFRYAGVGPDGRRVKGTIDGFSEAGIMSDLISRGLEGLSVKERKPWREVDVTTSKIKPVQLMHLSRQLASFVRAGVPILQALEIVYDEINEKVLRAVVLAIADALRRGDTFAEAVAAYDKVLPPFYVGVVRSAELTGRLDDVLEQLAEYIERDLEARRKLKSALSYPIIIMVFAMITTAVLAGFVLPRFQTFFESFNAKLPLATRMLLAVTGVVTTWAIPVIMATPLVVVAIVLGLRTVKGRKMKDALLLKIPLLRDVVRYAVIERVCRLLGSMTQAGIPLPDAMKIASAGANNLVYTEALEGACQAMLEGDGIAGPIGRTGLFPRSATQMIRVGEETGTLDQQLEVTAKFFAKELEYKLKNVTSLFEPIVITVMGVIVGFVAIALVSAIYGIYNQVEL